MGYAATLFYSSDNEATTLHKRITPSDEQYDEQMERWNDLADWLIEKLGEESGLSVDTKLQGSYLYGTQVNPRQGEEFDIDVGFIFKWRGSRDDGQYGPWDLRDMVQDALREYAGENEDDVREVAQPKKRCCRIHYKNSFHIDVPVYHLDSASGKLSLATQDDEWEDSDPKALYLWYKNLVSDDYTRNKLRRQIRYIKAWAGLKFEEGAGRPTSVMLTVLMAQALSDLGDEAAASDDDLFHQLVVKVKERLEDDFCVENPVDDEENINRLSGQEMTRLLEKLASLEDTAARAVDAESELEAADIWQEAFEFLFPMPESLAILSEAASNLPVQTVLPDIRVIAYPVGSSATNVIEGRNEIGPVPKNYTLQFEVLNYDQLPPGSECFWTARNSGAEAISKIDMGHRRGHGRSVTDLTAYNGVHHMDCVVRRFGRTISQRRVPVTIIGPSFLPLRNPPRPNWTSLRRRGSR